jgi:hypothetical protein
MLLDAVSCRSKIPDEAHWGMRASGLSFQAVGR